jgi:hypothetical protein
VQMMYKHSCSASFCPWKSMPPCLPCASRDALVVRLRPSAPFA